MAAPASRRTIGQLLKQGWTEIPEILASTGLAVAGLVMGTYACYEYVKKDGDNRRYKSILVVMRPDDPRVSKIIKD